MRKLRGGGGGGAGAYAAAPSLLHLYTAGYGVFEPRVMRGLHLLFLVPLVFLLFPFSRRSPQHRPSAVDWGAAALAFAACAYQILNVERLNERWVGASAVLPVEGVLGSTMVLLVIEACRRSLSPRMAVRIP